MVDGSVGAGCVGGVCGAVCGWGSGAWKPLPVQYADYTLWQRELLGTEDDPESVCPGRWLIGGRRWRGSRRSWCCRWIGRGRWWTSGRGGTVRFVLAGSARRGWWVWRVPCGDVVHGVAGGVWRCLLGRLGAGTDIPIGVPVAGRTDEALDDLVGFFVNTLVLRTDTWPGIRRFGDFVDRVRAVDLAAFEHQDVPFERLVEDLQPGPVTGPPPALPSHADTAEPGATDGGAARPRMRGLETERAPGEVRPVVQLRRGTRHRWTSHRDRGRRRVFRGPLRPRHGRNPCHPNDTIPAGRGRDTRRAPRCVCRFWTRRRPATPDHWNDTAREIPDAVLPALFEAQVARTPERSPWSLRRRRDGDLCGARRAREPARARLVRPGGGPGRWSRWACRALGGLVVALLAVLKAGGAYLPIDPGYPADRIGATCSTTPRRRAAGHRPGHRRRARRARRHAVLDLHDRRTREAWPPGRRRPHRRGPPDPAAPGNPAYVIYTSGSTGRPKGVVDHARGRSSTGSLDAGRVPARPPTTGCCRRRRSASTCRCGSSSGRCTTGATAGAGRARAATGTRPTWPSCIVAERRHHRPLRAVDAARSFLADPDAADARTRCAAVFCSGEALPAEPPRRFHARCPGAELHNLYGPTEAAVDVTALARRRPGTGRDAAVPIGARSGTPGVYVLDERLQPVPGRRPRRAVLGGVGWPAATSAGPA